MSEKFWGPEEESITALGATPLVIKPDQAVCAVLARLSRAEAEKARPAMDEAYSECSYCPYQEKNCAKCAGEFLLMQEEE